VFYATDDDQVTQHRQLGKQGELTPSFLLYWGLEKPDTFPVYPELHHPYAHGEDNLLSQLEAWLGEISPASRLRTSRLEDTDAVSLRFSAQGRWLRPTNVGFGLSYTLPILTALLTIRRGGLVLLENPEAHLHPRGQSKIGELMTRAVTAGAQVLAETHSDHILNTVRLAVKEGRLAPDEVQIVYFHRPYEEIEAVLPQIHADGGFTNESDLPAGFFDEFESTLFKLL
jgi:predicted ATPase